MKIVLANTWWYGRGGDATYTLALAEQLRLAGHEVVPFAMRNADNGPNAWDPWFAPMLPQQPSSALRAIFNDQAERAFGRLLDHVAPDVVHLQHVHRHLTPSVVRAARRRGTPVLWTLHDYELICPSGHLFADGGPCQDCRGHRYDAAMTRRCKKGSLARSALVAVEKAAHVAWGLWNKVDRFLSPSAFLAQKLVDFGVPSDRVFHLPPFVDAGPAPEPGPRQGWVFAGRFAVEKGVRPLLAAARRIPQHPLTLIGSGALAAEVDAAGLPGVRALGWLPRDAVHQELARHAVVVVPSIWYENQPFAIFEAQAAGCAVVASRIGGMPEQIVDGVDGVLVPPGDDVALAQAVRGLLDDPDRCQAIAQAGRRRVEQDWTVRRHLDGLLAHYRAVQ